MIVVTENIRPIWILIVCLLTCNALTVFRDITNYTAMSNEEVKFVPVHVTKA